VAPRVRDGRPHDSLDRPGIATRSSIVEGRLEGYQGATFGRKQGYHRQLAHEGPGYHRLPLVINAALVAWAWPGFGEKATL
jgi:hypothetical protein